MTSSLATDEYQSACTQCPSARGADKVPAVEMGESGPCRKAPRPTNLLNSFGQMSLNLLSRDAKFYRYNARNSISVRANSQTPLRKLYKIQRSATPSWIWGKRRGEKCKGRGGKGREGEGTEENEKRKWKGEWGWRERGKERERMLQKLAHGRMVQPALAATIRVGTR